MRGAVPLFALLLAIVFAVGCLSSFLALTPKRYAVSVGELAPETITATRLVADAARTNAKKQEARDRVIQTYSLDKALVKSLSDGARAFFSAVVNLRVTAAKTRADTVPYDTAMDGSEIPREDTRTWREVYTDNELLSLTRSLPVPISDVTQAFGLLEASDADISALQNQVLTELTKALEQGVTESKLEETKSALVSELQKSALPVALRFVGQTVLETYSKPTMVVDAEQTNRAREEAAAAVDTVYISRGTTIVQQGEAVTADQMTTLRALDLVKGAEVRGVFYVGLTVYLLVVYVLLFAMLRAFCPEIVSGAKQAVVLNLILLLTVLVQWLGYLIDPQVTASIFGVLLVSVLLGGEAAQAVNVALALSFALLSGGSGDTFLSSASLYALASMLLGGEVTILLSRRTEKRGSLIGAGAAGGVTGGLINAMCHLMAGDPWNTTLIGAGITAASGLLLSVFCVGMLSVWENMFDIVTDARLHELANANHPLLKKMMTSAPGTYHHSMMAASLAEGAAEAIGANALLARTGALYHDVGKLRRPLYFSENQNGRNIHDTLPPEESAGYIIAHVKDAEALLNKYHIPYEVRRIAAEHHGTTLVAYFYFKAKKLAEEDGQAVVERLFRYPGGLPSTKESAIVMLADSSEAAVRSLGEATREQIADMVHKVISGKIDDGQLLQCPLTLGEIGRIERSFCVTFGGLLHERIKYPDGEPT